MNFDDTNLNQPEKIISEDQGTFEIPKGIKIGITVIGVSILVSILALYLYVIICNPKNIGLENLEFSALLIFFFTLILIVQLPYKKMGVRITKIGILELTGIVQEQNQDKSEDIADLQTKINELELRLNTIDTTNIDRDALEGKQQRNLEELLIKFLSEYSSWAFSPLRIQAWGSKQKGFEELANCTIIQIKRKLRELLAKEIVSTRLSKKGSTLYIINAL